MSEPFAEWRLAPWLATGYALVVVAVLGYFMVGLPVQVTDSFGNLLQVQRATMWEVVEQQLHQRSFLRPLLWAQIKWGYELADGRYFLFFRGLHVAQVLLLVALALRLMRPRTVVDVAVVPLALAALIGIHTFAGTIREAFPINTFLTIAICCLGAANLSFARHRWWIDVTALLLFVFAALTVESGLLVWVVLVAGFMVGLRGVSRTGVAAVSAALVGYFALRWWLEVGSPGLVERASGFGFREREPTELIELFGTRPFIFYAYNVACSIAGVLFSEPRGGVWRTVDTFLRDGVQSWDKVCVTSSALSTLLLVWFGWRRHGAWLERRFERQDQLVLLFAAVLVANATLSYGYTKDVIMSPAGAFLAVALFAAAREWLAHAAAQGWPARLAVTTALIGTVVAVGWSYRAVGIHLNLRRTALDVRNEWVGVDRWAAKQNIPIDTPAARALRSELQTDAVWRYPTPPQFVAPWTRHFDRDR